MNTFWIFVIVTAIYVIGHTVGYIEARNKYKP